MKKMLLFLVLILFVSLLNAQEKNGTVYSEHEAIEKTKGLWSAFLDGDVEAFRSYFADTVYVFTNGTMRKRPVSQMGGSVKWWNTQIENVNVADDTPAFPDAIEYKKGGTWVQDWLRLTGTHTKTGININLHTHNLYSFNKEGKITSFHRYYNPSVFEEINKSQTTRENGVVYINHPYIVTARKVLNAIYNDKDVEKWASFFVENARFTSTAMKPGKSIDLQTKKEQLKKSIERNVKRKIRQVGYPDCVYYATGNYYVVYSWWVLSEEHEDKKIEFPFMVSYDFNDDGKIVMAYTYYSTNHFK